MSARFSSLLWWRYLCSLYSLIHLCAATRGSFELRLLALEGVSVGDFRSELKFCLTIFEQKISHNRVCHFGEANLDTDRLRNGTKIDFDSDWKESFTLNTEVWRNNGSVKELVFHEGFHREGVPAGGNWSEVELSAENGFRMRIAFRVLCAPDYYGPNCAVLCRPLSSAVGHFRCTDDGEIVCEHGWRGPKCDIASAHCDGCVNGICIRPGLCQCKGTGWTGHNCDQCVTYPGCKHGSCRVPNECVCDEGWGGHFCNEDLNYCTRHEPCMNGATCRNTGHGLYTCECPPGFTGLNCEKVQRNCSLQPCRNGGTCIELNGDYFCRCPKEYSGRHCQVRALSCADRPCQNGGLCENGSLRGFSCQCAAGWTGVTCDTKLGSCFDNPCLNGGICVEGTSFENFQCKCPLGFFGRICESTANECVQSPCMNGGRCINEVDNLKCICLEGFAGTLCEEIINVCDTHPCVNGGRCVMHSNGSFSCDCPPGFVGTHCDISRDWAPDPCLNGGRRVESSWCSCPSCFTGRFCETRSSKCLPKVEENGSEVSDALLIATSVCCVLLLAVVGVLVYRKRCTAVRSRLSSSMVRENMENEGRQSRYFDRPCLAVTPNAHTGLCHCEHNLQQQQRVQPYTSYKAHKVPEETRRCVKLSIEESEYGQRYAVEPTTRHSYTSVGSPARFDSVALHAVNSDLAGRSSPTPPRLMAMALRRESEDVYEEIDVCCQPSESPSVGDSEDSGIVNSNSDELSRRRPELVRAPVPSEIVTDLQTNV